MPDTKNLFSIWKLTGCDTDIWFTWIWKGVSFFLLSSHCREYSLTDRHYDIPHCSFYCYNSSNNLRNVDRILSYIPTNCIENGQCLPTDDALFLQRLCNVREKFVHAGYRKRTMLICGHCMLNCGRHPPGPYDNNKDGCNKSAIHHWLWSSFHWMAPMMRKCTFWCLLVLC